jgi:type IV secretion system protein VirB10
MQAQREALEALKKRPAVAPAPATKAPAPAPAPKAPGSMLFVSHELKEAKDGPKASEYTLAPGATKLPCILETKIISDVEGHFTCRVTTNVYDTATGRHLLVPQGSTVLGNDQANTLVYGSNRMDTVSLTLALPDGRTVDLGKAPVTDSQGVTGLTGDVNNHYLKLFGAVLIGGALKGGMSAFHIAAAESAGAGQVTAGVTALGNQATTRVVQPSINIRPTITVEAGALCTVLLLKPLHLPAMWQGTTHTATRR